MPIDTPKGKLLHGGPPSDFRFQLDEGRRDGVMHGASEEPAMTHKCAATEVHHLYESQPDKICNTPSL